MRPISDLTQIYKLTDQLRSHPLLTSHSMNSTQRRFSSQTLVDQTPVKLRKALAVKKSTVGGHDEFFWIPHCLGECYSLDTNTKGLGTQRFYIADVVI